MNISESELTILEYLWNQNSAKAFADIMNYFSVQEHKSWKKQTLNTFLLRLAKKGILEVDKSGARALYKPSISREEYYGQYSHKIVEESFDGSLTSFMNAFTGNKKLTAKEKKALLDYIEGL